MITISPYRANAYSLNWLCGLTLLAVSAMAPTAMGDECPELLHHRFNDLHTGQSRDLCQYQGKVVLVVNTASRCAFTNQYAGLEALHREHQDRGLVVLGFPSNDFGGQEPGSNEEIATFCRLSYGVDFPLFEKTSVVGRYSNALFTQLHALSGEPPRWNFHKYLVSRDGSEVLSFPSSVRPDDEALLRELRRLLQEKPVRATTRI